MTATMTRPRPSSRPSPTASTWNSSSRALEQRNYSCGGWEGQHKANRASRARSVWRECDHRDCAPWVDSNGLERGGCGPRLEGKWFADTFSHIEVMRALGFEVYVAECREKDWKRLQAEHLSSPWSPDNRRLGHWTTQLPTPTGRRLLTTCPDFPGARLVGRSRKATLNAVAWVYREFVVEERDGGRRLRDNFGRWEQVAHALACLLVGPPPEPEEDSDDDPDGPWVKNEHQSRLTPAERMKILETADPPVPYVYVPKVMFEFDISGHPQEGELGVVLQMDGYGVDGWWWWLDEERDP